MSSAPGKLLLDASILGHVRLDIVAIESVQGVTAEVSGGQDFDQRFREEHVRICGNDELTPGSSDADILCNHLEQRNRIRVANCLMRGGGYLDEPHREEV
jgi:hypothetical protein